MPSVARLAGFMKRSSEMNEVDEPPVFPTAMALPPTRASQFTMPLVHYVNTATFVASEGDYKVSRVVRYAHGFIYIVSVFPRFVHFFPFKYIYGAS